MLQVNWLNIGSWLRIRHLDNDLSIANNRYISSFHCIFEYENGHLYIHDTSSNGTLINRANKISKNDPVS